MPVFFVRPDSVDPPTITILGDLIIHLRDSLRVAIGETLWFDDGAGTRYRTEITNISPHAVVGRILDTLHRPPTHTPRLTLGQALLKGEKMDWVIQKGTELGMDALLPIESHHSVVRLKSDRRDNQLARWHRIALEAAQQSEQWCIPAITPPQPLASLLTHHTPHTTILVLTERHGSVNLQTVPLPQQATESLLVLIGPEGGWSPDELRTVQQAKAISVTLGPSILRAETAAIAALSILQSRLGNLG